MREGTTSRVTAANRPYGEFYDFYNVHPETFGSTHVLFTNSDLLNWEEYTCRLNVTIIVYVLQYTCTEVSGIYLIPQLHEALLSGCQGTVIRYQAIIRK